MSKHANNPDRRQFTLYSLGIGLVLPTLPAPAPAAERIVLKVADSFAPAHYIVEQGLKPWMKRVTELTGGQVEFQYFGAEQLGPLRDLFSLVQRGVADIAYVPPAYNLGKMPLSGVHSLPKLFSSSQTGTRASWDTLHNTPILQNDYLRNGFRPLFGFTTSTYNAFTRVKPVRTLADLKGMKLKSIGGNMASAVKLLGASPVDIPSPDTYQAIQNGTVDGTIFPTTSVYSYRLNEVIKYATFGLDVFVFYAPFVINEKVWQRLPESVRQAIVKAGQETMDHVARYTDAEDAKLMKKMSTDGIEVIELSAAEQETVAATDAPVAQDWAKEMDGKGLPGSAVLDNFRSAVRKYK
jgi:TRAP-type C4-dicarboxylate transport system substrate-binding protein